MSKKTLIIQSSPAHTASTVLVNALYGLIPELCMENINFNNFDNFSNDKINVVKTHDINLDNLISIYENKYNLYFICSERTALNLLIDQKYKSYQNVVVFSFDELNETNTNTVSNILTNIYNKINNMLDIKLNIESGINRIVLMNKKYEEIKHLDFNYYDTFYHIHGSHRNRKS
jgi:hypothetical protein